MRRRVVSAQKMYLRFRVLFPLLLLLISEFFSPTGLVHELQGRDLAVPSEFPTILAATDQSSFGETNILLVEPNLYLEGGPFVLDGRKHVVLQSTGGRVIIAATNPPSNDLFTRRELLSGSSARASTFNYAATTSPSDPLPALAEGNPANFGRSLWWTWTAPRDGLYVVNTVGSDSEFIPLLEVFRDDGYPPSLLGDGFRWRVGNEVGFQAKSNVSYAILVGGDRGSSGRIALNLVYTPAPSNDEFKNALVLNDDSVEIRGSVIGATSTPEELSLLPTGVGNAVWFVWESLTNTPLASRPLVISTAGSDFDVVMRVFSYAGDGSLIPVASLQSNILAGAENRFVLLPEAKERYAIILDGHANAPSFRRKLGNYRLRLEHPVVHLDRLEVLRDLPAFASPVAFSAQFLVRNDGSDPTRALRLRLVARAAENRTALHVESPVLQTNLGLFLVGTGGGIGVGRTGLVPLAPAIANCPAPFVMDGRTNLWGVFAELEEELGGEWTRTSEDFLFYGNAFEGGQPVLSYGVPPPTPVALSRYGIMTIGEQDIFLPDQLTDQSSILLTMVARRRVDGLRFTVTDAVWTLENGGSQSNALQLTTNGLLKIGAITNSTAVRVRGNFFFNGTNYARRDSIPIYLRPTLVAVRREESNSVELSLAGERGSFAILQSASEFPVDETSWVTISQSNFVFSAGIVVTNVPISDRQRFFRIKRRIP